MVVIIIVPIIILIAIVIVTLITIEYESSDWKSLDNFYINILNPLTPKSDQHVISPHNVSRESDNKVTRMKETINNLRSFWLLNKFSLSAP